MTIFENTIAYGSLVGVLLLTYSMNVAIEVLRVQKLDPLMVQTPRFVHTGLATFLAFAALPCIVWPAVYVGLFDGLIAALVAWLGLQLLGALATRLLWIRGSMLAPHLLAAFVALPVGYIMTLKKAPWNISNQLVEQPYETEPFGDSDSRIPTLMFCSFAGEATGLQSEATELVVDNLLAAGASAELVDALARDTTVYARTEMQGVDLTEYWNEFCAEPFSKFKNKN